MTVEDQGGQSNASQGEAKKNEKQEESSFGQFAHFVYTNEGGGNWQEDWGRNQT